MITAKYAYLTKDEVKELEGYGFTVVAVSQVGLFDGLSWYKYVVSGDPEIHTPKIQDRYADLVTGEDVTWQVYDDEPEVEEDYYWDEDDDVEFVLDD